MGIAFALSTFQIMKNAICVSLISTSLIFGVLQSASADQSTDDAIVDATIELARSQLGDLERLDSIKSITYKGSLFYSSGDSGTIDLIYQKPMHQKLIAVINDSKEVSALDDTEGWISYYKIGLDQSLGMEIFDPARVLMMQAAVREAFGFYKRPTHRGGRVTYDGREKVKDVDCVVLIYHHGEGIGYIRYFDAATGRLMKTVDANGVEYYEEGEIMVEGVRFPKKLVTTFSTAVGPQTMEFTYSKITLDKKHDASIFELPSLVD